MPGRHWLIVFAAGLAFLGVIYGVPTLYGEYQHASRTENAATQEYEQSKRIVPFGPTAEGQYANPEAYRNEWRAERDLRAQDRMAFWTMVMGLATVTAVLLLAATLWETRKAGKAAGVMADQARNTTEAAIASAGWAEESTKLSRDALLADQRAWIVIELSFDEDFMIYEGEAHLSVVVRATNIGKTPALYVHTDIDMTFGGDADVLRDTMRTENSSRRARIGRIILPQQSYERPYTLTAAEPERGGKLHITPYVIVCTTYEIWGDERRHQTALIYYVSRGADRRIEDFIAAEEWIVAASELQAHVVLGGFAD